MGFLIKKKKKIKKRMSEINKKENNRYDIIYYLETFLYPSKYDCKQAKNGSKYQKLFSKIEKS